MNAAEDGIRDSPDQDRRALSRRAEARRKSYGSSNTTIGPSLVVGE